MLKLWPWKNKVRPPVLHHKLSQASPPKDQALTYFKNLSKEERNDVLNDMMTKDF